MAPNSSDCRLSCTKILSYRGDIFIWNIRTTVHWLGLRQIKSLTIQFCQRSNSKSWISGNLLRLHWEGTHSLIYLAIWGNVYLLHFLFDFAVIASKFVNQPFWRKNCTICVRSEYVTFCTISATAVREMAVCVTFGAPHFGFPVTIWRHPAVDHVGGVSHGSGFRQSRS